MVAIAGGSDHCLALDRGGTVWAWGLNADRQVGDGTIMNRFEPTIVMSPPNTVLKITAGLRHSMALKTNNRIWVWGANEFGQLGHAITVTHRSTPIWATEIQVIDVSGPIRTIVCGGEHSLAITATLWGWGRNDQGQLGGHSLQPWHAQAIEISGRDSFVEIAAGFKHNAALQADGTVWTWGGNTHGELGDAGTADRRTPMMVEGVQDAVAVAAVAHYTLALLADGTIRAWGLNDSGQLGDGTRTSRFTPGRVEGIVNAIAIAGGDRHALAILSDGSVWAWGGNESGQLGDGSYQDRDIPVRVLGVRGQAFMDVSFEEEVDPDNGDPPAADPVDDDFPDGPPDDGGADPGAPPAIPPDMPDFSDEDDDDYIPAHERGPRVEHSPGCFVGAIMQ